MARRRSPSLTDGEARLMMILWDRSSGTVAEIVAALEPDEGPVNYSTVQTLLRILEKKGYIEHRKSGRAFVYSPVVDQQQARRRALTHLLARLFNGSPSLLVLNVLEHERISPEEVKRLKQMLDRAS
jgi:BlaI family penicillinase repressor